ncbi:hypothetical protein BH10CHL1_BH10CHL1_25420 [soil metagenome]
MLIRGWIRIGMAIILLLLLGLGVTLTAIAQQAGNVAANHQAAFLRAGLESLPIQQQMPITLTLRIADGLTGTKIVSVPLLLQFTLQVNLSSEMTASLAGHVIEVPAITVIPAISNPSVTTISAENMPITGPISQTAVSITDNLLPHTLLAVLNAPSMAPSPALTAPLTVTTDPVSLIAPLCPDEGVVISSPGVYQRVSGTIAIRGTVQHEKFKLYKLEYTPGADVMQNKLDYVEFGNANQPVLDNVLGILDTSHLPVGANTIRLTAFDLAGKALPTCFVIVAVHH